MFIRAYLRASTDEQDANRAREELKAFAVGRGLSVASWYVENESGAKLARPELFRLLADAQPGDVLLIEQVDRLSRLTKDGPVQLRAYRWPCQAPLMLRLIVQWRFWHARLVPSA